MHAQGRERPRLVFGARHVLKSSPRELAALAAASLLVLACAPAQYFGRQHDDVLYYLAAQALAEGRYHLFTSPGTPALTFVTPGLPLLLQPAVWAFGEAAGAYQALCALMLAACPWLLRLWLARHLEGRVATLAACVFAASPLVLAQAGTVMPEPAYLLVFTLIMLAPWHKRINSAAGPLLALLILVRPAGLSAVPAALAAHARARRWRQAGALAAWPLAAVAAWSGWCRLRSGEAREVFEWGATFSGAGGLGAVLLDNARFYAAALGSCFLPAAWGESVVAAALGALLWAAAAAGAIKAVKRDTASPEAWALAGAAFMHVFWGWRYERYFVALLPLILWGAAGWAGRRAAPVLSVLLGLQLFFHAASAVRASAASRPELSGAYAWLSSHTRPEEAIASLLYARDGYYAGRPAAALPAVADAAALSRALESVGVGWVLWQDAADFGLSASGGSALGETLARAGAQLEERRYFERAYDDPGARARIYRVLGVFRERSRVGVVGAQSGGVGQRRRAEGAAREMAREGQPEMP